MRRWNKLAIIAGGGELPHKLALSCQNRGDDFVVVRLQGFADNKLAQFPGKECNIAEIGKLIRLMKNSDCDALVMAGVVHRPDFSSLRPDWRGAALAPKVIAAARKGDGALLDVLVETFEAEGFLVVGAEEVSGDLFAAAGAVGSILPNDMARQDMRKASALVRALGPFDVGQGAVVRNGFVLAIEAAEGTDKMLRRCADLPPDLRGFDPGETPEPRGVLLKRPKPGQEMRVDLPTIGVETVRLVHECQLAGIALAADAALIVDRELVAEEADRRGIFVYGYQDHEL
jgi:UDP-2,3-diacylglucosamine hydrolase